MIGRLRGILLEKKIPVLLLEAGGVGYDVHVSMNTFCRLPDVGSEVVLHTHFVVREDAQLLYGFSQLRERELFLTLLKVNGVGPKLALTILSGMETDVFIQCVMENDKDSLVRLPGIGKKTAERLMIELRDRLSDWQITETISLPNRSTTLSATALQDAVSALIALGYKPAEASRAVARLERQDATREELIRQALKEMSTEPHY